MKTRRLSDKKIHIACDMDIFYGVDEYNSVPDKLIETFSSRFVYRKIKSNYVDGTPIEIYYANIKPGFIAGICNKYGIKKKFVLLPHKGRMGNIVVVDVDGEQVNVIFYDILLTDPNWYTAWNREEQLKSLLG
jgi:hypothetical protein